MGSSEKRTPTVDSCCSVDLYGVAIVTSAVSGICLELILKILEERTLRNTHWYVGHKDYAIKKTRSNPSLPNLAGLTIPDGYTC